MTILENRTITVMGGVDTHLDFHVAAAIDSNGGVLGVETFDTTTVGYQHLVGWLGGFGTISLVGVEGTGSYGAGLTRHLTSNLITADRPITRAARAWTGAPDVSLSLVSFRNRAVTWGSASWTCLRRTPSRSPSG